MQESKVARPQVDVRLTVNGREHELRIEPRQTLAELLRGPLALTGTKVSCDSQVCGSCTVLVDGLTVSSCTYLAADADGRDVRTVEGLANPETGELTVLQQSFIDYAAFQCGFCTPGFLITASSLLEETPRPTREQVIEGLEGNICRCTGYQQIVDAVMAAAERSAS
ncbi:MAG TPA: (2Fe-2S)-binding protein [Candidatus Limnocylindria bacterium]|nr:(2Fe-2S)-binding protein [Candidatus Limnocylindria bacterium]